MAGRKMKVKNILPIIMRIMEKEVECSGQGIVDRWPPSTKGRSYHYAPDRRPIGVGLGKLSRMGKIELVKTYPTRIYRFLERLDE